MKSALNATVSSVIALSLTVAAIDPANAQQPSSANAANSGSAMPTPGIVMLAELTPRCDPRPPRPGTTGPDYSHCETPMAARPSTIAEDTPTMDEGTYVDRYPHMGAAGYRRTGAANGGLCSFVLESMQMLMTLDQQFATADEEYAAMMDIYNALPANVRNSTRVMLISQVAQAGALCVLSAGLYCIAAIFNAIGNIFASRTNRRLQLANIRLSIANIRVTRLNISSNRLTLRFDARWLGLIEPGCRRMFPQMWAALEQLPRYQFAPGFAAAPAELDSESHDDTSAPPPRQRERRRTGNHENRGLLN